MSFRLVVVELERSRHVAFLVMLVVSRVYEQEQALLKPWILEYLFGLSQPNRLEAFCLQTLDESVGIETGEVR